MFIRNPKPVDPASLSLGQTVYYFDPMFHVAVCRGTITALPSEHVGCPSYPIIQYERPNNSKTKRAVETGCLFTDASDCIEIFEAEVAKERPAFDGLITDVRSLAEFPLRYADVYTVTNIRCISTVTRTACRRAYMEAATKLLGVHMPFFVPRWARNAAKRHGTMSAEQIEGHVETVQDLFVLSHLCAKSGAFADKRTACVDAYRNRVGYLLGIRLQD